MHKCNITSNDLVSDKEEDYMKQYNETVQKMINFDDVAKENIKKKHNQDWPQIPDHPYRILITGGSRSGKTNSLFNLIHQQPDIDKVYLHTKDHMKQNINF